MAALVEVSGAGVLKANGRYERSGRHNGITKYVKTGAVEWAILAHTEKQWRFVVDGAEKCAYFRHRSEGEEVPPVDGWDVGSGGTAPVPTINVEQRRKRARAEDVIVVQERLWAMRNFADAEVICAGERIPVHRAVLCAASPVFAAAFVSAMEEGQRAVYEVKESTPAAVEAMLRYMYSGDPGTTAPPLLDLAVQYELGNLAELTAEALVEEVTVENVRECVQVLKRHREHARVKHALKELVRAVLKDKTGALYLASI